MKTAIEVIGDRKIEHDLQHLGEKVANPRPAFERLLQDLHGVERELFATRGHGQWPQLKDDTLRQKTGNRPMVNTGALMRSLTTRDAGSVAEIAQDALRFGTSVFYARFQVKRFPLLDPTTEQRRGIVHQLRNYLLEELA